MHPAANKAVGALHQEILALEATVNPDAEVTAVLSALREAAAKIVTAASASAEAVRKEQAHREIIPQCRAARDKVVRLELALVQGQEPITRARERVEVMQSQHDRVVRAKPELYATPKELDIYRANCEEAQRLFETARDQVGKLVREEGETQAALLKARNELARLQFTERQLRPRELVND